jgi:hypothetical protein
MTRMFPLVITVFVPTTKTSQWQISTNAKMSRHEVLKAYAEGAADRVKTGPGLANDGPISSQTAISTETNTITADCGSQLLEHQVTAKPVPTKITPEEPGPESATEQRTAHSKPQTIRHIDNQNVATNDSEGIKRTPKRNMPKSRIRNMLRKLKPKFLERR